MTQRIGGLFSTLTHKDYRVIEEILEEDDQDDQMEAVYSMPDRELYWYVNNLEDYHKEILTDMSASQAKSRNYTGDQFISQRQNVFALRKIKSRIKRKLKGQLGDPMYIEDYD